MTAAVTPFSCASKHNIILETCRVSFWASLVKLVFPVHFIAENGGGQWPPLRAGLQDGEPGPYGRETIRIRRRDEHRSSGLRSKRSDAAAADPARYRSSGRFRLPGRVGFACGKLSAQGGPDKQGLSLQQLWQAVEGIGGVILSGAQRSRRIRIPRPHFQ